MKNSVKKRILVVGGAGYIGSHVVLAALDEGYDVTVFDDLSTGSKKNINGRVKFIQGSTLSIDDLNKLFNKNSYDGVIHLAASKAAGESMIFPAKYAKNNIIGGINLINACVKFGIKFFIFSSSAAVYGFPNYIPIDERHPLRPTNYYGYTKLSIEHNLKWFSKLGNIKYASLRYFNASGYDIKQRVSGLETNPQNLIPIVMEAALGIRPKVEIFGNSYETSDGTGVRDYIHVTDLAIAHIESLKYLHKTNKDLIVNLGTGKGYSVLDVIRKTSEISGERIEYVYGSLRDGDPPETIAEVTLAKKLINWEAEYSDLETIISSTWKLYKQIN